MKKIIPLLVLFPLFVCGQKKTIPDTSINGVSLMYGEGFEKKFASYKLPNYFEADHSPKLEFINADQKQKFTVFHCYGSGRNDICTFRLEFRKISDSIPPYAVLINDKTFLTGRGLHLGMTIEEFKKKVGINKYKSLIEGNKTKIIIELYDFKINEFLKSYNMPAYLAEYYFVKGKLTYLEFGFPNP